MKIDKQRKMVPARVGGRSLVAIGDRDFPLSFGNYFDFAKGNGRCVNMWAENLEEWARQNNAKKVECIILSHEYSSLAVVVDNRIGEEWLIHDHSGNREMCLTGAGFVPRALTEAVAEAAGVIYTRYCGCESPETGVHIIEIYRDEGEVRKHFRHCCNCRKEWEV